MANSKVPKKILLLGGTTEARQIAKRLYEAGIEFQYTIAGLVRVPDMPWKVVVGGFRQFGGLSNYIGNNQITDVLDVTHPYAQIMTNQAIKSCDEMDVTYWRFNRSEWKKEKGDLWFEFDDWPSLVEALNHKQSVMITAGQLTQATSALFKNQPLQRQILRTAVEPKVNLPSSMKWIKGVGPFEYKDELALLKEFKVDALVSKNSGGMATKAKIDAARVLDIPVYLLKRPTSYLLKSGREYKNIEQCVSALLSETH